eukprot:431751-Rhodomonas_salina.1
MTATKKRKGIPTTMATATRTGASSHAMPAKKKSRRNWGVLLAYLRRPAAMPGVMYAAGGDGGSLLFFCMVAGGDKGWCLVLLLLLLAASKAAMAAVYCVFVCPMAGLLEAESVRANGSSPRPDGERWGAS